MPENMKRRKAGTHHAYALRQYAKQAEVIAQALWEAENTDPWTGASRLAQSPYREAAFAQLDNRQHS
jgi:hypothetical protein